MEAQLVLRLKSAINRQRRLKKGPQRRFERKNRQRRLRKGLPVGSWTEKVPT